MTLLRRALTRALAITALCAVAAGVSACGSNDHHLVSKAFCLYNVDRAFHDLRTGHKVYGAVNIAMAVHNCREGFSRTG